MLTELTKLAETYKAVISQQLILFKEELKLSLMSAKWLVTVIGLFLLLTLSGWITLLILMGLVINQVVHNILMTTVLLLFLELMMLLGLYIAAKKLIFYMSFTKTRAHMRQLTTVSQFPSSELSEVQDCEHSNKSFKGKTQI